MTKPHKLIEVADKLGCYVGLFPAYEKGVFKGLRAALFSFETGNVQGKESGVYEDCDPTAIMDGFYHEITGGE